MWHGTTANYELLSFWNNAPRQILFVWILQLGFDLQISLQRPMTYAEIEATRGDLAIPGWRRAGRKIG